MKTRNFFGLRDHICTNKCLCGRVKAGETIIVHKGKKTFGVKVTEPNHNGGNVVVGKANGLTYTCWYNDGTWTTSS